MKFSKELVKTLTDFGIKLSSKDGEINIALRDKRSADFSYQIDEDTGALHSPVNKQLEDKYFTQLPPVIETEQEFRNVMSSVIISVGVHKRSGSKNNVNEMFEHSDIAMPRLAELYGVHLSSLKRWKYGLSEAPGIVQLIATHFAWFEPLLVAHADSDHFTIDDMITHLVTLRSEDVPQEQPDNPSFF